MIFFTQILPKRFLSSCFHFGVYKTPGISSNFWKFTNRIPINFQIESKVYFTSNNQSKRTNYNMFLTFLGCSSGIPCKERNVSAIALGTGPDLLLFDCGEGTQHQFQKSTIKYSKISAIFITHLHGDHVCTCCHCLT